MQILSYHLFFVGGLFQDPELLDLVKVYLQSLSSLPSSTDLRLPLFLITYLSGDEDLIEQIETCAEQENDYMKLRTAKGVAEVKKTGEI